VGKQEGGKQEGKGGNKIGNIKKVAAEITNLVIFIANFQTKLERIVPVVYEGRKEAIHACMFGTAFYSLEVSLVQCEGTKEIGMDSLQGLLPDQKSSHATTWSYP
jgi:hypothetical protein